MNVLFLSVNDLKDSRYRREGKRNLLDTKFGTADTLAFCGRLESAKKTRYGPRLKINDANPLAVIVGTFNGNVRKDIKEDGRYRKLCFLKNWAAIITADRRGFSWIGFFATNGCNTILKILSV